jgi:hypothetical protein
MIRTYRLRTSRKKWDIKFYTSHICSKFNCVSFTETKDLVIIKKVKGKCNLSNKIFQTSINLYSYDKDNPRTIDGNLLDPEEIVIPDSSFTIAIYFPLSYIFEIFIHSSQNFSRKQIIHTIKSLYSFIYHEEERTSTPQLFNLKKVCSNCNLQDIQSHIESSNIITEDCSICFTELNENPVKLKCNHIFHKDCISQWVKSSATCPICRYNIFMCSNCNGQRVVYYFYTGTVVPIEQRGENRFRNISNGTFGIHSYDFEDLNLDEMMYDNVNKKLFINVSASSTIPL